MAWFSRTIEVLSPCRKFTLLLAILWWIRAARLFCLRRLFPPLRAFDRRRWAKRNRRKLFFRNLLGLIFWPSLVAISVDKPKSNPIVLSVSGGLITSTQSHWSETNHCPAALRLTVALLGKTEISLKDHTTLTVPNFGRVRSSPGMNTLSPRRLSSWKVQDLTFPRFLKRGYLACLLVSLGASIKRPIPRIAASVKLFFQLPALGKRWVKS